MSFLYELQNIIEQRRLHPVDSSYTTSLFNAGEDEITKKIGEEAVELILAVKGQGDERIVSETADLLYHLIVLLAQCGLTLESVEKELQRRRN
jgi:phosphoribosyl-ATP pyrophosphohydrolase